MIRSGMNGGQQRYVTSPGIPQQGILLYLMATYGRLSGSIYCSGCVVAMSLLFLAMFGYVFASFC